MKRTSRGVPGFKLTEKDPGSLFDSIVELKADPEIEALFDTILAEEGSNWYMTHSLETLEPCSLPGWAA